MTSAAGVPVETATDPDRAYLDQLRHEVYDSLDRCIGDATRVAFLMYPMNGNVGNHMMWLALVDYVRSRGIAVAYAANRRNFRVQDLRRAVGSAPILFSGGVTMSHLWPAHVEMKRVVAREFPANRLVSLTSTIIWADSADAEAASSIFGTHDDVVVLARDPVSAANATSALGERVRVVTAPDSAFGLGAAPIGAQPTRSLLWLARDDVEQQAWADSEQPQSFDWSNDLADVCPPAHRALQMSKRLSRFRSARHTTVVRPVLDRTIVGRYVRASRHILALGHQTLDGGRVLVTDRVHAHVLAALRGQPVVLLPDKYGKNRAVFDYSTSALSCVRWADRPAEALELARGLADGDHA